jgi:hypothetical protein
MLWGARNDLSFDVKGHQCSSNYLSINNIYLKQAIKIYKLFMSHKERKGIGLHKSRKKRIRHRMMFWYVEITFWHNPKSLQTLG